jgi:tetratricopeptide (TPR) repeat protein
MLRDMGDDRGVAGALANLALIALDSGEPERAMPLYAESLSVFRRLGDLPNIALALNNMGVIAMNAGSFERARGYLEESLALYREMGQKRGTSWALGNLGNVARHQGRYADAISLYEEALTLQRGLGDRYAIALSLGNLGHALALRGERPKALALYRDAWKIFRDLDAPGEMAEIMERVAAAYIDMNRPEKGVRLLAAADHLRRQHRVPILPPERLYRDRAVAAARDALGKRFRLLWEEGLASGSDASSLME